MKVKLIKISREELKTEIEGEGNTLLNLLQKTLLKDKNVDMAGFDVPHPLIDKAILYVKTNGEETAINAVVDAAKQMKVEAKEFEKALEKALAEHEKEK